MYTCRLPKEHIANLVKVMISAMPSVRSGHPGFQSFFLKTDWLVKTSLQFIMLRSLLWDSVVLDQVH